MRKYCTSAVCLLISFSAYFTGKSNEFIPLGLLPSDTGYCASYAYGVDAAGQTVVGEAYANGQGVAFIWRQTTGIQPLYASDGAYVATGISEDGGTVVGRAATQSIPNGESFLFSNVNGFNVIGSIVQSSRGSGAEDVSGNGAVVVGWSPSATRPWEAYRWTVETSFEILGDLPGGPYESVAQAVSARWRGCGRSI